MDFSEQYHIEGPKWFFKIGGQLLEIQASLQMKIDRNIVTWRKKNHKYSWLLIETFFYFIIT